MQPARKTAAAAAEADDRHLSYIVIHTSPLSPNPRHYIGPFASERLALAYVQKHMLVRPVVVSLTEPDGEPVKQS